MEPTIYSKSDVNDPKRHYLGPVNGGATSGERSVGASLQVGRTEEEFFGHGAFGAASITNDTLLDSTPIPFIYTNVNVEFGFIPRFGIGRGTTGGGMTGGRGC